MPLGPSLIYADNPGAVPASYRVPPGYGIVIQAVSARFDGSGAAGAFKPCLSVYSQDGHLISRTFPEGQTVAAGGLAEVTFIPSLRGGGSASAGSQIMLPVDTPDAAGNGFVTLAGGPASGYGFTNLRALVPALAFGLDGTWEGRVRIPDGAGGAGTIVCGYAVNAVAGAIRTRVSTSVVGPGSSENTAYTDEAYQNTTVPASANNLLIVTFPLSSTLASGSTLNYKVTRNGSNAADTCPHDALLWHLALVLSS